MSYAVYELDELDELDELYDVSFIVDYAIVLRTTILVLRTLSYN